MVRSAVTVSLVPEARGGPFVFWDDLEAACRNASALGFDAVELFAPSPSAVDVGTLKRMLQERALELAAVGTGAGMVKHGLSLTSPDEGQRGTAIAFVQKMIDFGGPLHAPAIIGSMQGRWGGSIDRDHALDLLRRALNVLGEHAAQYEIPLIYEPLNRYETNLVNTIADGVSLIQSLETRNVRLLADLFHMNIEETNLAEAIRTGGEYIGHVHFVDSNRRPAGMGHMDFGPIAAALLKTGYQGYLSAEAFPYPDPEAAAQHTIQRYRELFS